MRRPFCRISRKKKAKEKKSFKADFVEGSASALPLGDQSFDVVVSGLALNFFPDLTGALAEMKRVLKKNGVIAAYIWDYAGKMEVLRFFWDAAGEVDSNATKFDEGNRFPICNPDNLKLKFEQEGITDIETTFIDIDTVFKNFDDYWDPFSGGQGPAPSYLISLNKDLREEIKRTVHRKLYINPNGSINLRARAIAVRGNYRR